MCTLDKLTIQNSDFQSKKYDDLPQTPRTPKGQISPKIYNKWNVSFIINDDFQFTPKSPIYLKCTTPLVQNNDLTTSGVIVKSIFFGLSFHITMFGIDYLNQP